MVLDQPDDEADPEDDEPEPEGRHADIERVRGKDDAEERDERRDNAEDPAGHEGVLSSETGGDGSRVDFLAAEASSKRMRPAAPSRSSNCPDRRAQRKHARPPRPSARAIGMSSRRPVMWLSARGATHCRRR